MPETRSPADAAPLLRGVWTHRELIWQMTKREVIGRYRGSVLGLLWSFVHPVFLLIIYTFVFSVVFAARWGMESESRADFAIMLFAGLIVYNLFSEAVNRAPGLILGNVNYVKRVVFPLDVLPVVAVGSALFHAVVGAGVLLVFHMLLKGQLPYTVVFWPLVMLPLVLLTVGLSWFLASLGVYVRDVTQTIGILTTALLFLSPIFYPASALPEGLRPYLFLNPLTFVIEQSRDVLIWGKPPHWPGLMLYAGLSMAVSIGGLVSFQKMRPGFADVL
ncbi:MAG: ABC transporter permease [Gammaproteobacteria bacterium]|nr:ABC transporter permease [Gammaproteobacteria bacterium]